MRAMIVEVASEIEQLVFEIRARPEQHAIQTLPPDRSDQPLHEGMGQGNVGDGLDFGHLQNPQVGLPLVKPIKRIMVAANVFWHRAMPSNGSVEHPAECGTSDSSGLDAESNDPVRVLIHDDQNPVGLQSCRFASEQIDTIEAFLHVAQEGEPGWAASVLSRPVVTGENPSNRVFVDWDVESQGDLLRDSGTAPGWIAILHLDHGFNQFVAGSLGSGLTSTIG
jgi:hypothetical protein